MPKTRVFADTNVILEAFRTGCWTAISSYFAIETVQKCIEETLTGNPGDPRHVSVPPADLNAGLAEQHSVTRKELASLTLAHHSCSTLDDGEKHLLAWLETAPHSSTHWENLHGSPAVFLLVLAEEGCALRNIASMALITNLLIPPRQGRNNYRTSWMHTNGMVKFPNPSSKSTLDIFVIIKNG